MALLIFGLFREIGPQRFEPALGLAAAVLVQGGQLFGVALGVRDVDGLLRADHKDAPGLLQPVDLALLPVVPRRMSHSARMKFG